MMRWCMRRLMCIECRGDAGDHSRVKLNSAISEDGSDYINANYIHVHTPDVRTIDYYHLSRTRSIN